MKTRHTSYSIVRGVVAAQFLLLMGLSAFHGTVLTAQNVLYTDNKFDITHRSSFKVDPASLALQIEIPLAMHTGRAGTDFPTTLRYCSKVWKVEFYKLTEEGGTLYFDSDARFAYDSESGWNGLLTERSAPYVTYSDDEYFADGDVYDESWVPECGYSGPRGSWQPPDRCETFILNPTVYMPRLTVHLPNGTSYQLRRGDSYVPDGQSVEPGVFVSVDGSQTKYVVEYVNNKLTNILYLPDGSQYRDLVRWYFNPESPTRYRDRNGNFLELISDSAWSDTLNRVHQSFWDPQSGGYDRTLRVPGFRESLQTYVLRYRPLYDPATGQSILTVPPDPTDPMHGLQHIEFIDGFGTVFKRISGADPEHYLASGLFDPVVLHQIVLPNGQSYTFTYNNWGEIDKVVHPGGGYERFRYDKVHALGYIPPPNDEFNRGVVERWVSAKGDGSDETHWTYSTSVEEPSASERYLTSTELNPDGTRSERKFRGEESMEWGWFGFKDCRVGTLVEERTYSATGQILQRKLNNWIMTGSVDPRPDYGNGPSRDPRLDRSLQILFDPQTHTAKASATRYTYSPDLNPIQVRYFNYTSLTETQALNYSIDVLADGSLLRREDTTYVVDQPGGQSYRDYHFITLPATQQIRNQYGTVRAATEFLYDERALLTYPGVLLPGWQEPEAGSIRGNLTTLRRWLDFDGTAFQVYPSGSWISTQSHYDQCGNVRKQTDANGNETQTFCDDSFSDGLNRNAFAYPTRILTPAPDPTGVHGSAAGLTTRSTFDFSSGRVTETVDANQQATQYEYYDPLGRLTFVGYPDDGLVLYAYGNGTSASERYSATAQLAGSYLIERWEYYDGLARTTSTLLHEGWADGALYDIHTVTEYDSMGRVHRVTNPFRRRQIDQWDPLSPAEEKWTTREYDALGRITRVTTPDGADVTTVYAANRVTVTDSAGVTKQTETDALGRLKNVSEDPGGLNYLTQYEYDPMGNLTSVTQGVQTRTYTFDSLSRLLAAENPESGLLQYRYDASGNLTLRRDARDIETEYNYDAINRVKTRKYWLLGQPESTPNVSYTYDGVGTIGTNSLGRLSTVDNTVSKTSYEQYDQMGRVTNSRQQTGTSIWGFYYTYDEAGNLKSETYPSGRCLRLDHDAAGRVASLRVGTDYRVGTPYEPIQYAPHGPVLNMRLGNGLLEQRRYDDRLQLTQIGLGQWVSSLGTLYPADCPWLLITNTYVGPLGEKNGNLYHQDIAIGQNTIYQSFDYDKLNRLDWAEEVPYRGATSKYWFQDYSYDQNGNMTFLQDFWHDPYWNRSDGLPLPPFDSSSNRFINTAYDDAGNITGGVAAYDAENRIKEVNLGTLVTYAYDGEGRRVKKVSGGVTTYYVSDAFGQLAAEYNTSGPVASSTSYLTADHLGSTRLITGASGQIKVRRDYKPFGDEIPWNVGPQRLYISGYGWQESATQKFTGKERDPESGLDFFGARYYSGPHGRFTSPDQPLLDQTPADPQSWNLYSYTRNNPLRFIDPTGTSAFPLIDLPFEDIKKKLEEVKQAVQSFWDLAKSYTNTNTDQTTPEERGAEGVNPVGLPKGDQLGQESLTTVAQANDVFSDVLTTMDRTGTVAIAKEAMTGDKVGVAIAVGGALLPVKSAFGKPFPVKPNRGGILQPWNPVNGRWLPYSANPGPQWTPWARFAAGAAGGYTEAKGGVGTTPVGAAGRAGQVIGWIFGQLPWF
jgi:RHS repeat-associated protein